MRKTVDHVNDRAAAAAASADVLDAIHAVEHAVRAHHQRRAREDGHALSPLEGRVLFFFARSPGATQSELAAHSGRDKGQLARLVGGLRERGFLLAEADEHDRRATRLVLSATGEAFAKAMQAERRRLSAAAAAGLGAAEKRQLLELLAKVHERLTKAL